MGAPDGSSPEAATAADASHGSSTDAQAACTSLTDVSTGVMPVFQGGSAPPGGGGTLFDGTYTLGEVMQFSGAASTIKDYGTIRITGATIERAEGSHRWSEIVSVTGNSLSRLVACDSSGAGRTDKVQFTATSTFFREYVPYGGGTRARTFYKVTPALDAGSADASDAATTDAASEGGTDASLDAPIDTGPPDGCVPNVTPIVGSVSCSGYSPSSYNPSYVCAPELHFASTYEASSDHTKAYPATVNFNAIGRTGAVLVVSSYEAVNWTVKVGTGATLTKVIVLGYKASTVTAPAGVVVDNRTPQSTYCSHTVSKSDPCVAYVQQSTGGNVGSMYGCYNATSFTFQ